MILLDTDTASALIKGNLNVFNLVSHLKDEEWGIPAHVAYELQKGVLANPETKRAELIRVFLKSVQILDFTASAALKAASVSVELKQSGKPIGTADELIAGHALSMNAMLVTNNTKHMGKVADLKLANWIK